jgi:hypothetical protein
MKLQHDTLTNADGTVVHFARVLAGVITLTVVRARWNVAPRGATWASFGELSYSIPAETLTQLRSVLGLGDDVRIGVSTPASEADVAVWEGLFAAHPGQRFSGTADAQFTCGTDADGKPAVRDGWVNLRLVTTGDITGGWHAVASAAATTARFIATTPETGRYATRLRLWGSRPIGTGVIQQAFATQCEHLDPARGRLRRNLSRALDRSTNKALRRQSNMDIQELEARLSELQNNIKDTENEAERMKFILEAFRLEEVLSRVD